MRLSGHYLPLATGQNRFDPRTVVRVTEDSQNYLVILRERPGVPFVYYSGAAWDRRPEFAHHKDWVTYVQSQRPDFDRRR